MVVLLLCSIVGVGVGISRVGVGGVGVGGVAVGWVGGVDVGSVEVGGRWSRLVLVSGEGGVGGADVDCVTVGRGWWVVLMQHLALVLFATYCYLVTAYPW